jgi:hypothetical protein
MEKSAAEGIRPTPLKWAIDAPRLFGSALPEDWLKR